MEKKENKRKSNESIDSIRENMKKIRDIKNTAYDKLPCGKFIGEYANEQAVINYTKKVEHKRKKAHLYRKKNETKKS
jgi:uncharacterized Zn finger protein (UPF0148 family)